MNAEGRAENAMSGEHDAADQGPAEHQFALAGNQHPQQLGVALLQARQRSWLKRSKIQGQPAAGDAEQHHPEHIGTQGRRRPR